MDYGGGGEVAFADTRLHTPTSTKCRVSSCYRGTHGPSGNCWHCGRSQYTYRRIGKQLFCVRIGYDEAGVGL